MTHAAKMGKGAYTVGRGGRGAVFLLVALLLWMGATSAAWGQPAQQAFAVDVTNARGRPGDGRTRLDVYTRVPYALVRFLRTSDAFTAHYEVTSEAYRLDTGGERQYLAERRRSVRTVHAETFAATHAWQRFDASAQSMRLRPGTYLLVVRFSDAATEGTLRREIPVTVRDLSGPVAVSDLILLDDYDAVSRTITPRVAGYVGTDAPRLQLFYEVYADAPREVRIIHEVVSQPAGSGLPVLGALFGRSDEQRGDVTYTQAGTMRLKAGRTPRVVTIPLSDAPAGEYLVRTRIERADGRLLAQAEEHVTVRWMGLANHMRDLDAAIAQLHYIAKDSDLEYIRSGETEVERQRRFQAFWKKRDPTPATARNERMEEYYYRVARANDRYGGSTEGWTTDRGHVLVLFGEPDRVEQHPSSARPYEVWHYDGIDRNFLFVDEDGRYRLLEPVWDEPSRIR